MEIKLIPDKKQWNNWLAASGGSFTQSWEWGDVLIAEGKKVERLAVVEEDVVVAQAQVVYSWIIFGWQYAFCPKGPTISEKSKIKNQKLIKSKHPLFPAWTQVLDLNKSEEDLLKSFHPKTRYNIRLAEKKGVTVCEESNSSGFEKFSKLYFETTKRQKYFGHDYQYHKTVWNNLKNEISHILIAYYNDIPLAAYQLWYLDGVIYYVYGGTSELHRNLMASNLLMWEAIKLGKKLGAEKFDMWGSLGPNYDANDPWSGFTRFKEGYATKFMEFVGSYDLVINPLLYKIYNLVYSLREVYLRFKK